MQSLPKYAVKLFAAARELAGADSLVVSAPVETRYMSVAMLRELIVRECPQLAGLLARSAIAVNHDFVDDTHILLPFDEVAIIPPVSGG